MLVKLSEIKEEYLGCPYCSEPKSIDDMRGCCGESNAHFTDLIVTQDDIYLATECQFVDDIDAKQGSL